MLMCFFCSATERSKCKERSKTRTWPLTYLKIEQNWVLSHTQIWANLKFKRKGNLVRILLNFLRIVLLLLLSFFFCHSHSFLVFLIFIFFPFLRVTALFSPSRNENFSWCDEGTWKNITTCVTFSGFLRSFRNLNLFLFKASSLILWDGRYYCNYSNLLGKILVSQVWIVII